MNAANGGAVRAWYVCMRTQAYTKSSRKHFIIRTYTQKVSFDGRNHTPTGGVSRSVESAPRAKLDAAL